MIPVIALNHILFKNRIRFKGIYCKFPIATVQGLISAFKSEYIRACGYAV